MAKVRLTKTGDTSFFFVGHPVLEHLEADPRRNQAGLLPSGEIYDIPDHLLDGQTAEQALKGSGLHVVTIAQAVLEPSETE